MQSSTSLRSIVIAASIALAACGGASDDGTTEPAPVSEPPAAADGVNDLGVRVVTATAAAETIEESPAGLVVLDIRTPEEFAEGHLEDAILLDFYRDDFADELAKLDRDVPYVLYCRSGNRSGQARSLMTDLGFVDVEDVDGGIVGWQAAGLPVVAG